MTTVEQILSVIEEIAPFDRAMEFDNAGLLVGDRTTEVTTALLLSLIHI